MDELVSVIIPTYKRADNIERAVKSVVNQTYKNIEIIVVDDNANNPKDREKTRNIVKKYKNIKFIENKENLGGALTRNVGIENANGNYIAFLDDDDEYISTKIEKQLKLLKEKEKQNKKVGMIYCYKNILDHNGNLKCVGRVNFEGNCLFEHMEYCIETTSTWLCTREALYDVGLFENVKAHQDNILLLKILANGYEVYRVPEPLVNFYLHNGNGITNKNRKYIEYSKTLIKNKRKYYYLLNSDEIEQIEYVNHLMLVNLYIQNNMKLECRNELKSMIRNNRFRKRNIKLIIKYLRLKRGDE